MSNMYGPNLFLIELSPVTSIRMSLDMSQPHFLGLKRQEKSVLSL